MLDEKTLAKTVFYTAGGVALSLVVWILSTLIEVDKRTAVIATKVEANHNMIKPLWEDYIRRNDNGNLAWTTRKPNFQAATEAEMEQETQIKSELQAPPWFQRESALRW